MNKKKLSPHPKGPHQRGKPGPQASGIALNCIYSALAFSPLEGIGWVRIHDCGPPQSAQWHQCPQHMYIKETLVFQVPAVRRCTDSQQHGTKAACFLGECCVAWGAVEALESTNPSEVLFAQPQVREQTLMWSEFFCLWCGAWKWSCLLCVGFISMKGGSSKSV